MKSHYTQTAVRYFETDQMKVAHHTSYLVWFEMGRSDLLRAAGFAYGDLEANGIFLPVVGFSCKISGSAGYEDRITIETWIVELRSRAIVFGYRARRGNRVIAEGRTKHLCVNENNRYRRIPDDIVTVLRDYLEAGSAA